MKNWTIEELYTLWRGRGYTKKQAQAKAEKDYKEMHREKSDVEQHQIMQEMLYNYIRTASPAPMRQNTQ